MMSNRADCVPTRDLAASATSGVPPREPCYRIPIHRARPSMDNGLGAGGEALHTWVFSRRDCEPRWRERLPEIKVPRSSSTAAATGSSPSATARRSRARSPEHDCSSSRKIVLYS
jgi:hypothetical protein